MLIKSRRTRETWRSRTVEWRGQSDSAATATHAEAVCHTAAQVRDTQATLLHGSWRGGRHAAHEEKVSTLHFVQLSACMQASWLRQHGGSGSRGRRRTGGTAAGCRWAFLHMPQAQLAERCRRKSWCISRDSAFVQHVQTATQVHNGRMIL